MTLKRLIRLFCVVFTLFIVWKFVSHFELLDFAYAPYFAALVSGLGFWFLSRQQEPTLLAISFGIFLVLTYKAALLDSAKPHPPLTYTSKSDTPTRLLTVMALLNEYHLNAKTWPDTLDNLNIDTLLNKDKWQYCLSQKKTCLLQSQFRDEAEFVLTFEPESSRDKEQTLWYLDDLMQPRKLQHSTELGGGESKTE